MSREMLVKRAGSLRYLVWLLLPLMVWWALRGMPFSDVWATLSEIDLIGLAGLVILNGIILLLFSSRAWLILRAMHCRVPYLWLVAYRLTAFSVSYFTPGQQFGGEPLQVIWLQRRHIVSRPAALTTVALDKLFELLANFTFLLIGILTILRVGFLPESMSIGADKAAWLLALLLIPLAYLVSLWAGRTPIASGMGHLPARIRLSQHRQAALAAEQQAIMLLRSKPKTIAGLALASSLIWVLTLAEYWLMVRVLGSQLNLVQTVFALTAARLAFLTPLPGGVGALEAGQVLAMQAIGLSPALGISISLLIRARDVSLGLAGIGIGMLLARSESSLALPGQAAD